MFDLLTPSVRPLSFDALRLTIAPGASQAGEFSEPAGDGRTAQWLENLTLASEEDVEDDAAFDDDDEEFDDDDDEFLDDDDEYFDDDDELFDDDDDEDFDDEDADD